MVFSLKLNVYKTAIKPPIAVLQKFGKKPILRMVTECLGPPCHYNAIFAMRFSQI
jgi:hypothetical protein